jgi:hypothetical protein
VSAYFDNLAARALGRPGRLAPPPRLRFGEPAGLDLARSEPGEQTVVTEAVAGLPVPVERVPAPAVDGEPRQVAQRTPAPSVASEPPPASYEPSPHRITERTRTVEREIVVREPVSSDERPRADPPTRSVATPAESLAPRPEPVVASERARVAGPISELVPSPREPARGAVPDDLRSGTDRGEPVHVRPLEPPPSTTAPVAPTPIATTVDGDRAAAVPPTVTIAIGRIELRAAGDAPAPPRPPERPSRPPRRPALGLDEYLEQRSRG